MKPWRLITGLSAFVLACAAGQVRAVETVIVFAAASLAGALDEVLAMHDGASTVSYAGSGTLARQIAAGAPADVVILANVQWMHWLAAQGVLHEDPFPLLSNRLVVIGPEGAVPLSEAKELPVRLGDGRLAIGQRDSVPAGIYAREWLTNAGLWTSLEHRLAETDNVRAAVVLVARGEAPLGIVYASDAKGSGDVATLFEIPPDQHTPITYPAAVLTPAGQAIVALMRTEEASDIFARHGFLPAREPEQ